MQIIYLMNIDHLDYPMISHLDQNLTTEETWRTLRRDKLPSQERITWQYSNSYWCPLSASTTTSSTRGWHGTAWWWFSEFQVLFINFSRSCGDQIRGPKGMTYTIDTIYQWCSKGSDKELHLLAIGGRVQRSHVDTTQQVWGPSQNTSCIQKGNQGIACS